MKDKFKTICLCIGILCLTLISYEFYYKINQPINTVSVYFVDTEDGFVVKNLKSGSSAEKAGISSDKIYKKLNETDLSARDKYIDGKNFYKTLQKTSKVYEIGNTITVEDYEKNVISFQVDDISPKDQLLNISMVELVKLIVSLICIFGGFFTSFFYYDNKCSRPIIYFLYSVGIAIFNNYTSYSDSIDYTLMTAIFFDISGQLTVSTLILFFARLFKASRQENRNNRFVGLLALIPIFILLAKYILILILGLSPLDNTFLYVTHFTIGVACICVIAMFIYLFFTDSRNTNMLLKFFAIASIYAFIPCAIYMVRAVLFRTFSVTFADELITMLPFITFSLTLSISSLQNRGEKMIDFIYSFITWLGYFTVTGILTYVSYLINNDILSKTGIFLFLIVSPYIYSLVELPIKKFLTVDSLYVKKICKEFSDSINSTDDLSIAYAYTAKAITELLNCSFLLIYIKNDSKKWELTYNSNQNLPDEFMQELLDETAAQKFKIHNLYDGSFCVAAFDNNKEAIFKIIIGHKQNEDRFQPGEQGLAEKIADILFTKQLNNINQKITNQLEERNKKIIQIQKTTIIGMANLIENRDGGTGHHAKRTSLYCELIAQQALEQGLFREQINDSFVQCILRAAPMHDIGKILISDSILKKPGKLTPEEFEEMKRHTTEGREVLMNVMSNYEEEDYVQMCIDIATSHHEKWNGTGYPSHLSKTEIPLAARIMAIADVFDALVSPRCYKEPWPPAKAFSVIEEDAGQHFDPVLVRVFLENKQQALEIMKEFKD